MGSRARIKRIKQGKVPEHVAIIPDGNGRWAKSHGYERSRGHKRGSEVAEDLIEFVSNELSIKFMTFYTFSTENWSRPGREVSFLMTLLKEFLQKKQFKFMENNVKLRVIGDLSKLPKKTSGIVQRTVNKTTKNDGLQLVMALNYGGRQEILRATRKIIEGVKEGKTRLSNLSEEMFRSQMFAPDIPDPDLLIRTSGEERISNFLLWQMAYTELWFTDTLWPAFAPENLLDAISEYQSRERRYGQVKDKERNTPK
ncbi:MAG: isoprenyl transferase [Candidatus Bipolaricaulota bacterium]